jgi:hypothetical protein
MTFYTLSCGIHESTAVYDGPCPHCAAFAEKLRAEWTTEDAPVEKAVVVGRREVDAETLRREYADYLAATAREVRRPSPCEWRRKKPRRVGNFMHRASDDLREEIVRRAIAGEPVKQLARASGFSRAIIYRWLETERERRTRRAA